MCDDRWDNTDAGVVCRQLGFGSSGTAIGSAGFGQGSGSIWLDSVTCSGNESTLVSCGHLGVGITSSCFHTEDAGVRCFGVRHESLYNKSCVASLKLLISYKSFEFKKGSRDQHKK